MERKCNYGVIRSKLKATYLEVTNDKCLNFHTKKVRGLGQSQAKQLQGTAKRREQHITKGSDINKSPSLRVAIRIFNLIAIPSATYGEEIWCPGMPKAQKTVQDTQIILARKCAGAP
ncbi:hypothetical protein Trydic_g18798 [Trypoxylus dichotomus]